MDNSKHIDNWKNLGSIINYKSNNFIFRQDVIILELDNCLIKNKINSSSMYREYNKSQIEINMSLLKRLQRETNKSIIILSNQIDNSKAVIVAIKDKLEAILEASKVEDTPQLELLAFFAMEKNCFSKPHTGMFKLLKAYYAKMSCELNKVLVVSNNSGELINRKNHIIETDDTDRAFANNISFSCDVRFEHVEEYLYKHKKLLNIDYRYTWNKNIISPEIRKKYISILNKSKNIDVLDMVRNNKSQNKNYDLYVFFILGAPRSGKSTYADNLLKQWEKSEFGKYNELVILRKKTKSAIYNDYKKLTTNRINIIIDENITEDERTKYIEHVKDMNAMIIYIEIEIGLEMAKLFNHVKVEEDTKLNVKLIKLIDFEIYRGKYMKPKLTKDSVYIIHNPEIIEKDTVTRFRY
jgi:DNA 3'-phosphatase